VHNVEWDSVVNIAVGWALTFVLGFERAIRGASAGDRTFSMIGLSTALIGTVAPHYPAVLGGAVTGIGFIGGGLCFRQAVKQAEQEREILHGVTTAASIFGAAAIGAIAGCGELLVATAAAVGIMLSLEIRHIPLLRYLDARRWAHLFNDDNHRHFRLHDLEHALAHPHQEFGTLRAAHLNHSHAIHEQAAHEQAAHEQAAHEETSVTSAGTGMSLVGPVDEDTLVKEGETAAILANEVINASIARGGR
jgi:putative Mg2+ transporter-C (MgtC) family protein